MNFDKSYDPYKAAYASMPSHSSANPQIKQLYINGHFCYVFKFGIVTNGLGIIRHISFYNKDFMASHPDIVIEKKSATPDPLPGKAVANPSCFQNYLVFLVHRLLDQFVLVMKSFHFIIR